MLPNPYPGLFIDIEGPDGCGASTQIDLLVKTLKKQGKKVFTTNEPTNNVIGGLIRGALTGVWKPSPLVLQLLFTADRMHHLDEEIIPALKSQSILITDRYAWSGIAFGSLAVDKDWLLEIHRYCILPDISIILKVSAKECLRRIKPARLHLELYETEDKLTHVLEEYEWIAKKFPGAVRVVDGERPIEKVQEEILKIIEAHQKFKKLRNLYKSTAAAGKI